MSSPKTQQQDDYKRIKWNGWGSNTRMMTIDPTDAHVVIHPTGKKIRGLTDFIAKEIGGNKDGERPKLIPTPGVTVEEALQKLSTPIINEEFVAAMQKALKPAQLKLDGESRLTHVVGKNYRDLWRMRKGKIARSPDAIVLPESHGDCVAIVEAANRLNVVLIPFGGGTNVTGGVEPAPFETKRMIVSVDMRRMTKMLSIDKESRIATFECGVLGPDLDEQLGRHGFMMGHDPDSYIHSTLGGWIAARGSGAYSNKYGDIEDMVLGMRIVTPKGVIETPVASRQCAPDLAPLFIGSEGIFGIITEATVKIELIPPVRHYEGWLFPTFEIGYSAFYKATKEGISPTCMRLYDDDETRMGFALKTDAPAVQELASKGIKKYLQYVKRFSMDKISLCIVGFEGTAANVAHERKQITAIFQEHNAFCVGQGAGHNWQEKKYDLPYVRDFALGHGYWADVFETTALYGHAIGLWRAVKTAVRDVWKAEGKQGWIGCHTAHQYKHGCCLYFTYAGQQHDDSDLATFLKVKRAATEAMLRYKGNLSHHHGIGYEHIPWMARHYGPVGLALVQKIKSELDPNDICNPYKVLPVQRKRGETEAQFEERSHKLQMFDKMGLPQSKL
jgi:alkyldihydroxyacetonephosphate synthase